VRFPDTSRSIMPFARLATAMLLCLSCAGCTDDRTSDPNASHRNAAAGPELNQDGSNAASTEPPTKRPRTDIPTATIQHAASSPGHLRSESMLMFEHGISGQAAEDLLQSSRSMSDAMDRMDKDAASIPEAQDLTRHYRSSLTRAMGQKAVLEQLSCGLTICLGIARARSNAEHEAWGRRFASDASSPTFSYAEASENLGSSYQNRFIFSTDPAANSIGGN